MEVKGIVRILLLCFLIVLALGWQPVFAQKDYLSMSLKELLSEDLSIASLPSMEFSKIPVAITIITREDIEKTPTKNILDLIDTEPGQYTKFHMDLPVDNG